MELNLPEKRKMLADAPPWKRAVSFALDFLIIQFIIFGPFSAPIEGRIPVTDDFTQNYNYIEANPQIVESLIPMFAVIFVLIFAYFVIFEFRFGQTPGKMIMKLRLMSEGKEKLTLWRVIVRNLAVFPVFPFSLLWIIDPLYMFITGRRLSDNISKTRIAEEISI